MNYLFVKNDEYTDYLLHANYKNRIRAFWKQVLTQMPKELYSEVSNKPTNIIKQKKEKFNIFGATPYQFETNDAGKELKAYLELFAIFVECDNSKEYTWEEDATMLRNKLVSYL